MINIEKTLKVLEISEAIQQLVEERDQVTNSDYQGAIEAQILIAIQYGQEHPI